MKKYKIKLTSYEILVLSYIIHNDMTAAEAREAAKKFEKMIKGDTDG